MNVSKIKQQYKQKTLRSLVSVSGNTLLLECLEKGATTNGAIRLVKCNLFGKAEPKIHLEYRNGVWLPFFYLNETSDKEVHLYRMVGEELLVDFEAGAWLINATGLFGLGLYAEGFIKELGGNLHQTLLARMAVA